MRDPWGKFANLAALGRRLRSFAFGAIGLVLASLTGGGAPAAEIAFALPIGCTPGRDCNVQNHVDHDPGPGAADFACGTLAYDGHKGTDIRIPDLAAMARGVTVFAAAPGVVRAVRDGMPDISFKKRPAEAIRKREIGNGVIITHEAGWETIYAHMREGSVSVRPGQRVAAGDLLGLVGLSGKSEFPHLHFEVRRGNAIIDPFTGARAPGACGGRRAPLWTPAAHAALAYDPTGLLRAGFADRAINMEAVEAGRFRALRLPRSAPALVFWTLVFGVQRGDEEHIRFIGPDGALFAEYKGTVPKTQAQRFRFVGKRSRGKPWPAGRYRGTYRLARGKPGARAPVIEHSVVLEVD